MTNHLHHGLARTDGARDLRALILMTLVLGGAACGGLPGKRGGVLGAQEVVYLERPATWFEDVGSAAQVSSDGRWALVGRFGQPRLVDLRSGQVDRVRLRAGLDEVTFAVFRGDGLARLGRLGEQRGWFVEEGGAQRLLGLPGDASPRWSPDGTRVAFRQRGVPAVFVGPVDAPARHDVSGRVTGLTWSAAGPTLYVTVWDDARGVSSLLQLGPDAPDLRTVAGSLDGEPFESTLAASDDGRRVYLALASAQDQPPGAARHQPASDRDLDIYEIEVASGARRAVVAGPGDDFAPVLAGDQLHFTHNDIQESVVVLPAAGGLAEPLVPGGSIPSWGPAGRQLAFTHGGWRLADWALNLDAAVVDLDERGRPSSPPRPIVSGYHEDFTPAWSPDGKWLAYHSHRAPTPVASYPSAGSTDDVYLRAADPLGPEIRLTDFGYEVGWADWSPDGRRLVFSSWEKQSTVRAGVPWIVTIDPGTGQPAARARLPLPAPIQNAEWLAWSPDGAEIALIEKTAPDRHTLWRVAADGARAERLVDYPIETYGGVDWLPDGQSLVYAARDGERLQLFSVPRSGGSPRRLSDDPANLLHPQVSPDGTRIACSRLNVVKELRRAALR
jgi:dipeptidyl aminopeptidase/acylaminoacyl peptidase